MKTNILETIREILDSKEFYLDKDENGNFKVQPYIHYNDDLESDTINKLVGNFKENFETGEDKLFEFFQECYQEVEWQDFNEIENKVQSILENKYDIQVSDDEIRDYIAELAYFEYPLEELFYNEEIDVNIMVDLSGENSNHDFAFNSYVELDKKSDLFFLMRKFNYTENDIETFFNMLTNENISSEDIVEKYKDDKFVLSMFEELQECGTYYCNCLTFLTKITVREYLDLIKAKQENKNYTIELDKNAYTGLVNFWSGCGGTIDIQLPASITISNTEIFSVELNDDNDYGYSVQSIYGMYDYKNNSKINIEN